MENSDLLKVSNRLFESGFKITDIYDLVNTSESYSEAIPVLVTLLEEGLKDDGVKEGLIRSLAVKEAIGLAGSVLITEYLKTPKDKSLLRWAIGNSMYIVVTNNEVPDILEIVQDKSNGISRQMFVASLSKFRMPEIENVLIESLNDNDISLHALAALGKLKSLKAKLPIEKIINMSNGLLKKEAQKALGKINSK